MKALQIILIICLTASCKINDYQEKTKILIDGKLKYLINSGIEDTLVEIKISGLKVTYGDSTGGVIPISPKR